MRRRQVSTPDGADGGRSRRRSRCDSRRGATVVAVRRRPVPTAVAVRRRGVATAAGADGVDGGTSVVMTRCSICQFVSTADGPTHNARTSPLRQTQCRRSLHEGHPFHKPGQCVSATCVHKQKCNTCGLFDHLYGTQALTVKRWRLNKKGRLVRKPTKRPLCKDDFVCAFMTDVSIQSMVDNSVSVSTAAAQDAHTRRRRRRACEETQTSSSWTSTRRSMSWRGCQPPGRFGRRE